jgi:hypothetical protein
MKCIQCGSTECPVDQCRFSGMPHAEFERVRNVVNGYANAKVKAEQVSRYSSRPDHDMSCSGLPLKPGT